MRLQFSLLDAKYRFFNISCECLQLVLLNLEFDRSMAGSFEALKRHLAGNVRVCNRGALILEFFRQRAATRKATLQVSLTTHGDYFVNYSLFHGMC